MSWENAWHHGDYIQVASILVGAVVAVYAVRMAYLLGEKTAQAQARDASRREIAAILNRLADEYLDRSMDINADQESASSDEGSTSRIFTHQRKMRRRATRQTLLSRRSIIEDRVGDMVFEVEQYFGTPFADRYARMWIDLTGKQVNEVNRAHHMSRNISVMARLVVSWVAGAKHDENVPGVIELRGLPKIQEDLADEPSTPSDKKA